MLKCRTSIWVHKFTYINELMDWLIWYNTKRVHFAFGNKMMPVQFLLSWKPSEKLVVELPAECKSGWTYRRS
ncbi:MAG TPA: hypothetical protein VJI73_03425 [Candidatus Paceibacterota bacterium]